MSVAEETFQVASLGARLRAARVERRQSVRGLARSVGCSPSLLSQIELGKTAPSVGILYSLASELGVSTDELLGTDSVAVSADAHLRDDLRQSDAPAEASQPIESRFESLRNLPPSVQAQVQRREHRRAVDFDHGVRWERLTTTSTTAVDFLEIIYAPGASSGEDDHAVGHEGFEYGVVLEGELSTRIGSEDFTLSVGDSIAFDASTPHVYRNDGEQTARAIWFVTHRA